MNNLSNTGETQKKQSWIKSLVILLLSLMNSFFKSSSPMSQEMKRGTTSKSAMNISQLMVEDLKRPNFSPHEFFVSDTARKLGIDNTTNDIAILVNLDVVADKIQEIRDALGQPIKVTSAYRCLDLNRAIGSRDKSQHVIGCAIDFQCPKFGTPRNIVDFIKERGIEVDQALEEGGWVHLSIKLNDNRNQFASLLNGEFKIIT